MTDKKSFAELQPGELLDLIADSSTAGGSGAVAAAMVATAAAMAAMAAGRSPDWDEASAAIGQAEILRRRAEELIPQSVEAFSDATQRLEARGQTPSGDVQRDWKLGVALKRAADTPLTVASLAVDVTTLAAYVADACDRPNRPEAVSACILAEGAASIAAHLVEVNLATTSADPSLQAAQALAADATETRNGLLV